MSKHYTMITGEPLTPFEESVLRMLHDVAAQAGEPRAMVGAIMMDSEEVITYYHNATMQDMMVAKGFLDLDIQNDNILGNLPWYLEQAKKHGLIEFMDDEDWEEDEDTEEEGE